jgi:hypothetical protein
MGVFLSKRQREALDHARKITPIYREACKWKGVSFDDPVRIVRDHQKGVSVHWFEGWQMSRDAFQTACSLMQDGVTPKTAYVAIKSFPHMDKAKFWPDVALAALEPCLEENRYSFGKSRWAMYACPELTITSWELKDIIGYPYTENVPTIERLTAILKRLPKDKRATAVERVCSWAAKQLKQGCSYESGGTLASQFLAAFWFSQQLNACKALADALKPTGKHIEYVALLTHLNQRAEVETYFEQNRLFAQLGDLLIHQKRFKEAHDVLDATGKANYHPWGPSHMVSSYKQKMAEIQGILGLHERRRETQDAVTDAEEKLKYGEITQAEYDRIQKAAAAKRFCVKCGEAIAPTFRFCPACGTQQPPPIK